MSPMQALFVVGAVLGASASQHQNPAQAQATEPSAIDPKADKLLRKMSSDLPRMKNVQFDTRHVGRADPEHRRVHGDGPATQQAARRPDEYAVSTFNWKVETAFPADTFAFTPPRDAAKINFVTITDIQEKQRR